MGITRGLGPHHEGRMLSHRGEPSPVPSPFISSLLGETEPLRCWEGAW